MDSIYGARGEVVSGCEVDGRHVFKDQVAARFATTMRELSELPA